MGRQKQGWGQLPELQKHAQDTFQPSPATSGKIKAGAAVDSRHGAQSRQEAEGGREGNKGRKKH